MRRNDAGEDAWSALRNGDEAHDVQATGMLSAIVAPLGAAGVPVWVVPPQRTLMAAGISTSWAAQRSMTPWPVMAARRNGTVRTGPFQSGPP
jgi:hypothetical protein